MDENEKDKECQRALASVIVKLRDAKPEERSEKARQYAITITELEKAYAYFTMFVIS